MKTPTAFLTSANSAYPFTATPGSVKFVATSGATGAGVIRHQFRVLETDPWTDNPNITFVTNKHLHFKLEPSAVFNQIVVTGADGTTAVNVTL